MTVAENIRKFRKERKLTQKQLGNLCKPNISESTIRKYELGLLNPKIETIQKIADALNVNVSDLLSWDTDPILEECIVSFEGDLIEYLIKQNEPNFSKEDCEYFNDLMDNYVKAGRDIDNIIGKAEHKRKATVDISHQVFDKMMERYNGEDITDLVDLLCCYLNFNDDTQNKIKELMYDLCEVKRLLRKRK